MIWLAATPNSQGVVRNLQVVIRSCRPSESTAWHCSTKFYHWQLGSTEFSNPFSRISK